MKINPYFFSNIPYHLHKKLENSILETKKKYEPYYYFDISRKLYDLIPSKNTFDLKETHLLTQKVDSILKKHGFSLTQLNKKYSLLKDESFLKYALFKNKNASQQNDFIEMASNRDTIIQWELATSITDDLTLSNVLASTSVALTKKSFFGQAELETLLATLAHALDFFNKDILLDLYKNVEYIPSHFKCLINSPQNISLNPNEKFQIFFGLKLNSFELLKATQKLKNIKENPILEKSQIRYLAHILSEAKLFYLNERLDVLTKKLITIQAKNIRISIIDECGEVLDNIFDQSE